MPILLSPSKVVAVMVAKVVLADVSVPSLKLRTALAAEMPLAIRRPSSSSPSSSTTEVLFAKSLTSKSTVRLMVM